jgi:AAA domain
MFDLSKDIAALRAALKANPNIRIFTIDPLTAYLGRAKAKENAEVHRVLAPLVNLAEETGVLVLVDIQLNKVSGKEFTGCSPWAHSEGMGKSLGRALCRRRGRAQRRSHARNRGTVLNREGLGVGRVSARVLALRTLRRYRTVAIACGRV